MKSVLCVTFLCFFFVYGNQPQWESFKDSFKLSFKNDEDEHFHAVVFAENLKKIEKHNALFREGKVSWTETVTKFSHLSENEFKSLLTLKPDTLGTLRVESIGNLTDDFDLPDAVNWTAKGKVTGVKNQRRCGSCWAFCTIAAVESHYAIKNNELIEMSEQDLVDCVKDNSGCKGGSVYRAFKYIQNTGVATEKNYPYTGQDGPCEDKPPLYKIDDCRFLPSNEYIIKKAVAKLGPVAVSINAEIMQHYGSGIIDDPTCDKNRLNHCVLIVGYGNEGGKKYWIVKNSWGNWGEEGYFRVAYGKNTCGINKYPRVPVIKIKTMQSFK